MNDSTTSKIRPILKLKTAQRKPLTVVEASPARPAGKHKGKPGADWSDEFKRQMQEDMDALIRR